MTGTTTIATALESIGSVMTVLLTWFSKILDLWVTHPMLLIIFAIFVLGGVIGLTGRVRHVA